MNRQLKERVIGAIVLVALAVVIIPEFLGGADKASTVNVDLKLPATPNGEVRSHSFRLDQPEEAPSAPVPVPVSADEQPVARVKEPGSKEAAATPHEASLQKDEVVPLQRTVSAEQKTDPAEITEKAEPRAPAEPALAEVDPGAGTAGWAVQLGSFSSEDNAQRLVASMKEKGYEAFIARFESEGRILHRVRVGPADSREDAQALARRLAAQGQSGRVVSLP